MARHRHNRKLNSVYTSCHGDVLKITACKLAAHLQPQMKHMLNGNETDDDDDDKNDDNDDDLC